jgi:hypothetical protein
VKRADRSHLGVILDSLDAGEVTFCDLIVEIHKTVTVGQKLRVPEGAHVVERREHPLRQVIDVRKHHRVHVSVKGDVAIRTRINLLFDKVFPDARYVFLWRDPEENVSSIIDAWRAGGWVTYPQLPGWDGPWSLLLPPGWQGLKGRPVEAVAAYQWATTNQTIMDDLEALPAERRHVVRYADFVADPAAVVAGIAAFAGIAVDPALTERTGAPLPASRHTLEPPRPDKWKKNAAEIAAVLPGLEAVRSRLQAFR